MTVRSLTATVLAVVMLMSAGAAAAHHGAAGYDNSKMTVLKAEITEFIWKNPHSEVRFDAVDDTGTARHWAIEAPPPTMLTERGWNRSSLKPGEKVTLHLNAARNGAPAGILRKVVFADGHDLWAYPPPELLEELTTRPRTSK